tara:strand:- start:489 stop:878 length:390 start_codon:yes stop_codon:yes gene_type:complete
MKTMRIYKDFDKIYLENFKPFEIMVIQYAGNFDADMVANGNFVLNKDMMFFYGIELNATNVLFTYEGNFTIKKAYIYKDNKLIYINTRNESDDVNTIQSTWNESTSKYTDFFRTNRRKPYRQTILRKRK